MEEATWGDLFAVLFCVFGERRSSFLLRAMLIICVATHTWDPVGLSR